MKTSTLVRNGISNEVVELVGRLIGMIPWPERRSAMGDVTISLLDGKPRVAENVFGWNRNAAELGMNEFESGISCLDDPPNGRKPKTEEKFPELAADIAIMRPVRTTTT